VPVDTNIAWEEVIGVTGYIISIGTTPQGNEIVNEQTTGNDTSFTPPLGLPESTLIYVTITLFFFDQPNIVCDSISFTTKNETDIPECTMLNAPIDGAQNVNVATSISWDYASRATGYRIRIGTTSGSGDIANNMDVGNVLSYNPPTNLPPSSEIFVEISPYNENGSLAACVEEQFTTASLGDPPGCAQLITPLDGAVNVDLSPFIEWTAVPGATGYILYLGDSPFENNVLDGAVFSANSTFVLNFEPNSTYFIRIIPFNAAGQAQNCGQQSFSTILGCGPFIDPDTGEVIFLGPDISLPDEVGICENSIPTQIFAPDVADGYRWYQIASSGAEDLISETNVVPISAVGRYRYEAYNIIDQEGVIIECTASKEFTVTSSSIATIESITKEDLNGFFTVEILVSGIGDYEFILDDPNGIYQDSPIFTMIAPGIYTIYVRDKKGCGIAEEKFKVALPPTGFPPYFSPNEDGINDTWHYVPPLINPLPIGTIFIYDRFGKILAQIGKFTPGWDGTFNKKRMPEDGYWYKAITKDGTVYTGHFTLMRGPRR
jgi:gliding motility-associated-like protein